MSYIPFADALRPLAARMPQVIREREILRVAASLRGGDGQASATAARKEVLKWVERRSGGRLPAEAWKHDGFEHLAGGRNSTAVRIADESGDVWAIRADDPDKTVAQRIWTTEVTVGHKPGERALFSVRLLVSSPERELSVDPAVPGLVRQVAAKCGLDRGTVELDPEPWVIGSDDDALELTELLVDPARDLPAFVLTVPNQADDPLAPLLDPGPLASATVGLARVIVLPARFTWLLTDRFGKRLSVFDGAVRVYLPGFSADANPYGGHDLVLAERIATPAQAAGVRVLLQRLAATESVRRFRLGHDVLSFASVREVSLDLASRRLAQEGATDTEQLEAAHVQINALREDIKRAEDAEQWLSDEHEAAEDRAKTAEAQLTAAGYRIQQLTAQLKERGDSPDANIPLPNSWDGFADWCEQHLVGRVLLTPRARREVRAPVFRDYALAARCLLWLANDYRERRLGGGDGDLRVQVESGVQNDRCGADSFSTNWQGERADVEWHIKNGGNTRDPTRCLRIYYFWSDATQQVVIASMPAHMHTGAT